MRARGGCPGMSPPPTTVIARLRPLGQLGIACLLAPSLASALSGCGQGASAPAPPLKIVAPVCVTRDPGPSPLRRLTRREIASSLDALLGPGVVDASVLPADERAAGFDNNADVMSESPLLAETLADLAAQAGERVAAALPHFVPCAADHADGACAAEFIASFGRRAWRRPLTGDEQAALATVFAAGAADPSPLPAPLSPGASGFGEGIARVTAVLLGSPQFLYRIELGGPPAPELPDAVALAPHELATRLSYLLWGTTPDDTLLAAADDGQLATRDGVARVARRLLDDPRAHAVTATFHAEWLGLDGLDNLDKDPVVFPAYTPALGERFRQETLRFVDHVVWNQGGTLAALLTSPVTFADSALASFYGAPAPTAPDGDGFGTVATDPARRAGLLTQASFLAVHAKPNQTSPVHRGRFVREQLFCTTPPPPPADIEIRPPALDPRMTSRQRFAEHTANSFCQMCHQLLDPIGFGFEHYDGLGHWRDTESGLPVDARGSLTGTDVDGDFDGAVALGERLAGSGRVALCYATEWFRFGYGRGETTADACTVADLANAFAAAKGDVRELLVALTQTDAFRYRRAGQPGDAP